MKGKFLKVLAVLACLTLGAGFAACGGKGGESNSSSEWGESGNSSFVSESVEEEITDEGIIYEISVDGTYATVTLPRRPTYRFVKSDCRSYPARYRPFPQLTVRP